jgi:hypothetical protein
VGIYDVLPYCKAKQQYPCIDDMIFISFQNNRTFIR